MVVLVCRIYIFCLFLIIYFEISIYYYIFNMCEFFYIDGCDVKSFVLFFCDWDYIIIVVVKGYDRFCC